MTSPFPLQRKKGSKKTSKPHEKLVEKLDPNWKGRFDLHQWTGLPLDISCLVDEYIHVYCPGCKKNVFPIHSETWNSSVPCALSDEFKCTWEMPCLLHVSSAECLINKTITINEEYGPSMKIHIEAHKLDHGNLITWELTPEILYADYPKFGHGLPFFDLSSYGLSETDSIDTHPFSSLLEKEASFWCSVTCDNEHTRMTLRLLTMTDKELCDFMKIGPENSISHIRATLVSNLEGLFC